MILRIFTCITRKYYNDIYVVMDLLFVDTYTKLKCAGGDCQSCLNRNHNYYQTRTL